MSSLIEQAAQRLEQLRQAGITIPEIDPALQQPSAFSPTTPPAQLVQTPPAAAHVPIALPPRAVPGGGYVPLAGSNDARDLSSLSRRVELDLAAIAAAGIVTPNSPRSHTADQYRVIKRPLISNAMGRGAATVTHGNLIMVTSALPGEGKSFTSINLAMSIAAELDHTVMLVDADVARPSVLRMLGLPQGPGLLERAGRQGRHGQRAAAHQRRQADRAAQRHAAPARHRTAGQRRDEPAARRHGQRATPTASSSSTRRRCC